VTLDSLDSKLALTDSHSNSPEKSIPKFSWGSDTWTHISRETFPDRDLLLAQPKEGRAKGKAKEKVNRAALTSRESKL
jgi:hypothetical protein